MNKTEARYASVLSGCVVDGSIVGYDFGCHKLLLAEKTNQPGSRACWYLPDFAVYGSHGTEFHEVKGWHGTRKANTGNRRDGRLKVKIAASRYPHFRFAIVWFEDGAWHREDF